MAQMLLHNTDGDNPGGGGGAPQIDPTASFQRLLEKNNNDGVKLAATLFDDNFQLREKNRQLREAQPKEGSIVLSPDDAKIWKQLQDSGVEMKEIKTMLKEFPDLKKANKELTAMEHIRDLADLGLEGSKLKIPVLKDLILNKFPDATFRFANEKDKDGNDTRNAYVKPTADGQETTFAEFASANFADYLPALKVNAEHTQPIIPGATPDPKPSGQERGFFDNIRKEVETRNAETQKAQQLNPLDRFGRAATL